MLRVRKEVMEDIMRSKKKFFRENLYYGQVSGKWAGVGAVGWSYDEDPGI